VDVFLGLIGLLFYLTCVVALAAAVTWTVVRFSPAPKKSDAEAPPAA
jgi:hypothetical protein